ncbi:MAG: DUF2628 domain-containing protein [Ruminococcaceae bacterium]|nr:DUF2628 domain-containing protein [Oscillospiraceae bacterium]
MANSTVQCEHCGTICNLKDGFCKNCWKKLPCDSQQNDFIIDGVGQSEWENFIDKNSDRYIEVYKKYEGKKIFLNINLSAMFFGLNWMLYRKMNKLAFISYFIFALLSVVLQTLLFIPHIDEMKTLNEDIAAYEAYLEGGGQTVIYNSYGTRYSPDVVKKGAAAEKQLFEIQVDILLNSLWIIPIQCISVGLLGDALYKKHILNNIKTKEGGTSVANLLGMRILLNIVASVAEPLLILPMIFLILGVS